MYCIVLGKFYQNIRILSLLFYAKWHVLSFCSFANKVVFAEVVCKGGQQKVCEINCDAAKSCTGGQNIVVGFKPGWSGQSQKEGMKIIVKTLNIVLSQNDDILSQFHGQ